MSDSTELTKLGSMQPHVAAGICYVPLMYVHLIASIAFLITEPKEHQHVRFHASQSLLVTGGWLGSTLLFLVLMILAPLLGIVLGALLSGVSEDLGAILMLVGILGEILFGILAIVVAMAGPFVLFALTLVSFLEMDVRIPVLATVAGKLAGSPS